MSSTTKKSGKKAVKSAAPRAKAPAKPPLVRGEIVVQKVIDAALQELAEVGYHGFRMEEVAIRADVNKTTVYRRWPTKSDLVRDTLETAASKRVALPDTGSLRTDLLAWGHLFVMHACHPLGQSIFRMLAAEGSDSELREIVKALRGRNESRIKVVIANAIARGELAPDTDHKILILAFVGAVHHQIFVMHEPVNDAFLNELIDLVLLGARRPAVQNAL